MLHDLLQQQNLNLLQEVRRLSTKLQSTQSHLPIELASYYQWGKDACWEFQQRIERNLSDLSLSQKGLLPNLSILPDILSNTQEATRRLQLLNRFTAPIFRSSQADLLCLKFICWLHFVHPQTQQIPAAISDGEFACLPIMPTIYFVPASAQYGLRYLPLLFHEFGHLLYACHKLEMDALVHSLRLEISQFLEPSSLRDRAYARRDTTKRRAIVNVWYSWAQELFCDAVGFVIGGNAFVYAFSSLFQMLGESQYHIPSKKIAGRRHPVTWIRIRLLAERMRRAGQETTAQTLEKDWDEIADAMGIVEDYYGFYEPELLPRIQQTIDDMLIEADPYSFAEGLTSNLRLDIDNLVRLPPLLLNRAWLEFFQSPETYPDWELRTIQAFIER